MRFGSVCSGIEAASVASAHLGWEAAWFSEIEPFPCSVLAHHYPDVPNLGDMTLLPEAIREGKVEAPDMLVGVSPCLDTGSAHHNRGNMVMEPTAFNWQSGGDCRLQPLENQANTLTCFQTQAVMQQPFAVRRLTPRECERLQGFPDDYTLVPHRGKAAADGPRYKALGNSWAVNCVRWIFDRIDKETKHGIS